MLVCVRAFARNSPLVPLFDAIASGRLRIAVSTSILLEYQEISQRTGGAAFVAKVMTLLTAVHETVVFASPSYQFDTIPGDVDDNKFANCAIVTHADYIITDDAHFAALANAGYKPQPITPLEFIRRHLSGA